MGADIHVFGFKKNKDTNEFEPMRVYEKKSNGTFEDATWKGPWADRWYDLFSLLSGIRGNFEEVSFGNCGTHPCVESDEQTMEELEWCHSPKWFDWVELDLGSQLPECVVENPWKEGDMINPVREWVKELCLLLRINGVYPDCVKPGEVVIQIAYDS